MDPSPRRTRLLVNVVALVAGCALALCLDSLIDRLAIAAGVILLLLRR